jgi:hypothetical protein
MRSSRYKILYWEPPDVYYVEENDSVWSVLVQVENLRGLPSNIVEMKLCGKKENGDFYMIHLLREGRLWDYLQMVEDDSTIETVMIVAYCLIPPLADVEPQYDCRYARSA